MPGLPAMVELKACMRAHMCRSLHRHWTPVDVRHMQCHWHLRAVDVPKEETSLLRTVVLRGEVLYQYWVSYWASKNAAKSSWCHVPKQPSACLTPLS